MAKLVKSEKRVEQQVSRRNAILNELLASFTAGDSLSRMMAARMDPTKPALINSQLQNYANMMNGGGMDVNSFLGGDFASSKPNVPVTFGAGGGGPFDLAIQKPGVDPQVMSWYQNMIQPTLNSQLGGMTDTLSALGSPLYHWRRQGLQDVYPQHPNPPIGAPYQMPPMQGAQPQMQPPAQQGFAQSPIAPAMSQSQPPPAQMPGQPIPQYAVGTPMVPRTGLAVVHQGEQITPAPVPFGAPVAGQTYDKGIGRMATPAWANPTGQPYGQAPQQQQQMPQQAPPPAQPMQQPVQNGPVPIQTPVDPAMGAPAPQGGLMPPAGPPQTNPLQAAIQSLLGQVQSGGPMNAQFQNMQNQTMADQTDRAYMQQRQAMLDQMGARGLGGSGLQVGADQALFDSRMGNMVQGQNQIAMNAATGNWNALQQGAGNLGQMALGAGQFGLNQQQQQFMQQQSLFQQLLNALGSSEPVPAAA